MMRFKNAMFGGIATCLIGLTGVTAFAQTPQASGQYGYSGPAPSPQAGGGYACHEKAGCYVVVGCPNTCYQVNVCHEIARELEQKFPIVKPPTCYEPNTQVCELVSEYPPQDKRYVDIWRNHYIPVKVVIKPYYPQGVTSFDVRVNYREVHVLCDERGTPIPPTKVSAVLKELEQQYANNAPGGPATAPAAPATSPSSSEAAPPITSTFPAPAPSPAATPIQAPATQPATAAAAPAMAQKQWVWLVQEGLYGYGYQRADGLWEIDPGSRRATF